jgi:hypothetical protein
MSINAMMKRIIWGLSVILLAFVASQAMADDHHDVSNAPVYINGKPVGGTKTLALAPSTYYARQEISFTAQTKHFADGAKFRWIWGDGEPDSEGVSVKHAFDSTKTYRVKLVSSTGELRTTSVDINVSVVKKPFDTHLMVVLMMLGLCVLVLLIGSVWLRKRHQP